METAVKTYGSANAYARDLAAMQANGWTKVDVVEKTRPRGCLTLFPAGSDLIVTYRREPQPVAAAPSGVPGTCPRCGERVAPSAFWCPRCRMQLRS